MIGRGSPYFGGMPVPSTVDSQVSPYGPRNLEVTRIRVEVAASAPDQRSEGNATKELFDQQVVPRARLGRVGREGRRRRGCGSSRKRAHEAAFAATSRR